MSCAPTERNRLGNILVMLKRAYVQAGRRCHQLSRLWVENGGQHVLDRVRRAVVDQLAPIALPLSVRPADVLASDLTVPRAWSSLPINREQPVVVNWVTTPPVPGSGGHTTTFRLIEYLQKSGNHCHVYL